MSNKLTKGEVASLLGIQKSQIRFYEKKGLLDVVVDSNGYSEYGFKEVDRLEMILLFKKMGMSLKEIKEVINKPTFDYAYYLDKAHKKITSEIQQLQVKKIDIEKRLATYKEFHSGYTVEDYEERTIHVIKGFNMVNANIRQIYDITREYEIDYLNYNYEIVEFTDKEVIYGFFYQGEHPSHNLTEMTIPGGKYFSFQVSYKNDEDLEKHEKEAMQMVNDLGYRLLGPKLLIDNLYNKFYDMNYWNSTIQFLVEAK
ncbi:MerR family transcriptional regulator [Acidaminobacter sp. JC074]|uniref:MerR family transcriptional regulator n=1 Tax=Acidaminobacter sp. JC074 TaxID=2530199 RepID=UPI001F10F88F|nr:MerR family transcriptional regulator [Acidaminobacter sp. JC074]MCH4889835.1 MerR family transcriptional regulator [Acidaminobacter sp. JC074]